jgi:peptidoglycan/xylan/chitin deacetylase (PgdA/CDA1 family)
LIGLAVAWVLLFPPLPLLNTVLTQVCPGAVYGVETQEKKIALTIDDAPHFQPETTRPLLHLLAQHQARATFFIITDKIASPQPSTEAKNALIQDLVAQGHELGNHLTRDEPSIHLGDRFAIEVARAQAVLSPYAPQAWLRPGGGWCNRQMMAVAQQRGYQVALGSIWPYDTLIRHPGFAAWFILQNLRPGAIVILHDAGSQGVWGQSTYQTLRRILPILKRRGYQVVTLSELLQTGRLRRAEL